MSVVRELSSLDQRMEGPGVYLLPDQLQWGLKPRASADGREYVPFSWASEFPPLGEFMLRFPQYWIAEKTAEAWVGQNHKPDGIYWGRYDPRALGGNPP